MEDLKMYMDNIDEYINDENIVVTYKWLSVTLGISYNLSKRLLHKYVSSLSLEDSSALTVTYFVMGSQGSSEAQQTKVFIVPSSILSDTEESLDTLLCVHVYSISKSKLQDTAGSLYATDYDIIKSNLHQTTQLGGIACEAAKLRSDADIADLRKQATYRPSTPQDSRHAPDPRLAPRAPLRETAAPGNKAAPVKKEGGVASMFANAATKKLSKEVKQENGSEDKHKDVHTNKSSTKSTTKKGGNISGFFTKGVNPRDAQVKKEAEEEQAQTRRTSPRKRSSVKDEVVDVDSEEETPIPVKKEKTTPKKTSPIKSQKKTKATKAKVAVQAKRSRILQVESDSSEDEASDDAAEDDEPPPPSPPRPVTSDEDETPLPRKDTEAPTSSRNKKRKQVDKTYQDEDGFFVTSKEYVDVTDSEAEEEVAPAPAPAKKRERSASPEVVKTSSKGAATSPGKSSKQPPKKQSKKAKPSPPTGKQASIMSFFKKK